MNNTHEKQKECHMKSTMDMDCSGQGECQPEPIDAESPDIQPSLSDHKLEKVESEKKLKK